MNNKSKKEIKEEKQLESAVNELERGESKADNEIISLDDYEDEIPSKNNSKGTNIVVSAPAHEVAPPPVKTVNVRETEVITRDTDIDERFSEVAEHRPTDKHPAVPAATATNETNGGKRFKISVWFAVVVMGIIAIASAIISSVVTARLMSNSVSPPNITVSDNETALEVACELIRPNAVEIVTNNVTRGSGVIMKMDSEQSYIITNFHVIKNSNGTGAGNVAVRFYSETDYYVASCMGFSELYDIAVIKVSHKPTVTPYTLDSSKYIDTKYQVKQGEKVVVMGNAMGQGVTSVTDGIVGATSKMLTAASLVDSSTKVVPVIQTSAAIVSGFSGGIVFNSSGTLVGIATYRQSTNTSEDGAQDYTDNISYFVPFNIAYAVYNAALIQNDGGKLRNIISCTYTSQTTIDGKSADASITVSDIGIGINFMNGKAIVKRLDSGVSSPFELNDEIVSVNGVTLGVNDYCTLAGNLLLFSKSAGGDKNLEVEVMRSGSKTTLSLTAFKSFV